MNICFYSWPWRVIFKFSLYLNSTDALLMSSSCSCSSGIRHSDTLGSLWLISRVTSVPWTPAKHLLRARRGGAPSPLQTRHRPFCKGGGRFCFTHKDNSLPFCFKCVAYQILLWFASNLIIVFDNFLNHKTNFFFDFLLAKTRQHNFPSLTPFNVYFEYRQRYRKQGHT